MECITGPISRIISTQGMPAVYEALDDEGKKVFEKVKLCLFCSGMEHEQQLPAQTILA